MHCTRGGEGFVNSVGVKRVGIVVLQEEAHLPEAEAVTIAEVLAVVAVA